MPNLFEALGNTLRGLYCATAGPVATGLSVLGSVYEGLGGEEQGEDLRAAGQLYRSAQQVACNRTPDSVGGVIAPPFTGGQCPGVLYQFTYNPSPSPPFSGNPILSAAGRGPLTLDAGTDPNGGVFAIIRDQSGAGIASAGTNDPDVDSIELNITNMTRLDGQPDDCGDPPPEVPPYNPEDWTFNPTIDYDDDDGNTVTINPEIVIQPNILGPGGDLEVPFTVEFSPEVNLTGNFNLNTGDLVINGGGNGSGQDFSGPQEEPQEPGEQEEQENIIGVRVISSEDGSGVETTEILQTGGNPNIYVPRTSTVAFRYKTGVSGSAWGTDLPVKSLNAVIWADRPAIEVSVTPEPGWAIDVRRILEKRTTECG